MPSKKILKPKGPWLVGLGGLAAFGGWWLAHEIHRLDDLLSQSMPVHVMTGAHRSAVYIYLPEELANTSDSRFQWEEFVPTMSNTPWKLISMAQSDDKTHRMLGLTLLASLQHLTAASCCQVAQASDWRMAIGLARTCSADLRMLLPPPPLPSNINKSDIWQDFANLLSSLPQDDGHMCAQFATALALQEGYLGGAAYAEDNEFSNEGDQPAKPHKLKKPTENVLGTVVLEALLRHSTITNHRRKIVCLKGLPLLMKFQTLASKDGDATHQRLIAQIVGNLALDKVHHRKICQAGWVSILANWSRKSNLEVALPAVRALANLDTENMKVCFEDGVYLASPQHWDIPNKILGDVVFVHGLLGGAFKTWRQKDPQTLKKDSMHPMMGSATQLYTYCWPKDWLAHDCPHLRIIIVDYDTHLTEWGRPCPYEAEKRTLEERSSELLFKLRKAGVGDRPVVWVAHSMGGLMVKQMLLQSESSSDSDLRSICEKTRGIAFYSVPHRGSPLATFNFGSRYLLLPSAEVRELQKGSTKLKKLNEGFVRLLHARNLPCLSFCETQKTTVGGLRLTAMFVNPESADLGFGEVHLVDTDHLYICKPNSQASQTYFRLAGFVQNQIGCTALDGQQHPLQTELEFAVGASFF